MQSRLYPFLLILSILSVQIVSSQNWQLKKEASGIKIYTRTIQGYKLKEFKGVATVDADLKEIEEALRDAKNHSEWLANCEESEILEDRGDEMIVYSVTEAPFPLSDRDNVAEIIFKKNGSDLKVTLEGKPNYIPEKDDYVRVPFLSAYWLLEPLSDGKTQVTYQVHADPGGSVPTWLVNSFAVDNPYKTLECLRNYLKN